MEGHDQNSSKKRTAPDCSGGPTHKKLRSAKIPRRQAAVEKRPPSILQWLQPTEPADCDLQKRLIVQQYVEMVTSMWGGHDEGQSPPGKKSGSGGSSWKAASGGLVSDGADSSSGVSGQEGLSTRSGMKEAFRRSSSESLQASDMTQERRPPSPVYAAQLELVKQAMSQGQDPGVCKTPLQLEEYILAKLAQLCKDLPGGAGQNTSPSGGEAGQLLTPRQQCGDHLEAMLRKIVRDVRRVVLGSAPLKGSILEQVAEAAFSNKKGAVSPCEKCGLPAAVDIAQVLSITLGRTLDGSEMRIGHAAVALLKARLQAAGRGASGSIGEEGAPSIFPLLLSSASPSPSNSSQQSNSFRTSSALSSLTMASPPAHAAHLPPPAPKFSVEPHPMLLPPLPSVNFPPCSRPMLQALAAESPSQASPPVWRHDFPKPLAGVLAADGPSDSTLAAKSDLLDIVKGAAGWSSSIEAAALSYPSSPELPTMMEGLISCPVTNGGRMSIMLPLKARAREMASKQETQRPALTRERGEDVAALETSPKPVLEHPFHVEEPSMERHMSVDEMTIQACMEEHEIQLPDAFKVAVTADEDDGLDLVEDPLAAAHEWEGFLGADLSAAGPLAGVSEAELLSLADQLLRNQGMALTSGTLSARDEAPQKSSGFAENNESATLPCEQHAMDFLSKGSCSTLAEEPIGRRFGVGAGTSTSTQQGSSPSAGLAKQVQETSLRPGSNRYTEPRLGVPNVDDEQPQKVRSLAELMSAEAGSIVNDLSTRKNKRPSQTGFRWETQKSMLKRLKGSKIAVSNIGQGSVIDLRGL